MKIKALFKPEKVVASNRGETAAISHMNLDVEHEVLEATNSYVFVSVPVEIDKGDTSGVVPVVALDIARRVVGRRFSTGFAKAPKLKYRMIDINCNGGITVPGVGVFDRVSVQTPFPELANIRPAIEAAKAAELQKPGSGWFFEFAFCMSHLHDLVVALGGSRGDSVRLSFQKQDGDKEPNNQAIMVHLVKHGNHEGAPWGILMPYRIR